jgi:hypothetical protein
VVILLSSTKYVTSRTVSCSSADIPVPGDYDGDADGIAVYHPPQTVADSEVKRDYATNIGTRAPLRHPCSG